MEGVLSDGMCRCCATEGSFKDFQVAYQWMGVEEIYGNMLKDCFDITLSVSEEISNGGICEVCITQLRNACNFKQQVQRTEEKFQKKLQEASFKTEGIKMEISRFEDDDSNISADDFSSPEYEVPIKVEKVEEKPKKRAAAKASTSKAKKTKASEGEPSVKRTRVTRKKNVRQQAEAKKKLKENVPETKKNQHNLKTILHYSNSNPIRNKDALGFGCQFCSEQFPEPKKLKEHFLQEHKIKELFALINCRLFEYFVKLDITDLKCTLCYKTLDKLEDFMDHITAEHNIEVYKEFKSVIVPFKFDTEKLTCVECNKEFVCFKHLLEHMTIHFSNYMCSVCGKGFVTDRLYMRHVRRHTAEELKCKDCDKVFGTKEKLRNHQYTVHLGNRKGSRCLVCNKKLLNYWQKIDHMVKVHGVPELVLACHICEKTFKDQRKLTLHIKKDHLLERKHKCQECQMMFFSSTRLKIHMAKHTGLRQFKCDICLKAYGRKNTLREHMRIHANDRRYACEHCGQAFVQNCSLRSHRRSKHGIV
ncbi:zinc finger protein 260-like isoform X23 [Maniola hyperantus]|uniref:zinc finger protein 260-like isoform X23 n=1 Tax=Aphantopus hyperantus TaxID=2795564 RepID=UPI001569DCA8|nr:zinc finger protein 260-like isoform X17 [Maniola hyperantus]